MSGSARYGVLSDVHANLAALQAALRVLAAERVERYLSLGDVVGYGPWPRECVELLNSLGAIAVAGNHERMLLGLLDDSRASSSARLSLAWTRDVLGAEHRKGLAELPMVSATDEIVLAHGSLDEVDEYVRSERRARELLDRLSDEHPGAQVLLLGHTHEAWAFSRSRGTLLRGRAGRVVLQPGEQVLLNPGSVGQSRDHKAHVRFLLLDLCARRADFRSLPYDLRACRRELERHSLPSDWCFAPPSVRARLRNVAKELLRGRESSRVS